ncbi:MAG: gene transfer agent family protein [Pseudomonadota bacterium]
MKSIANPHRGEVAALVDGEARVLRLTLGSLAELEANLAVADLFSLVDRFESGRPGSRDILEIIAAGHRGNEYAVCKTADEVADVDIEIDGRTGVFAAYTLAGRLLAAAFSPGPAEPADGAAQTP